MKSKKNKLKSKALKRNELKMARVLQFDRSKKTNIIEYMLENPNYFEPIFKLECTLENINKEFDLI
jgi:hypothetical protein